MKPLGIGTAVTLGTAGLVWVIPGANILGAAFVITKLGLAIAGISGVGSGLGTAFANHRKEGHQDRETKIDDKIQEFVAKHQHVRRSEPQVRSIPSLITEEYVKSCLIREFLMGNAAPRAADVAIHGLVYAMGSLILSSGTSNPTNSDAQISDALIQMVSPLASYTSGWIGSSAWNSAGTLGYSPNANFFKKKVQQIKRLSDPRILEATKKRLIIQLETDAKQFERMGGLLTLHTVDHILAKGLSPIQTTEHVSGIGVVRRSIAAWHHLLQSAVTWLDPPPELIGAFPEERIFRSLTHIIAAASIVAPYYAIPTVATLTGMKPPFWVMQSLSTAVGMGLCAVVEQILDTQHMALYRYVMNRLEELERNGIEPSEFIQPLFS